MTSLGRGCTRTSAESSAPEADFPGVVEGRGVGEVEPTCSQSVRPGLEPSASPKLVRNAKSQARPRPTDSEPVGMGPAICAVTRPPGDSGLPNSLLTV